MRRYVNRSFKKNEVMKNKPLMTSYTCADIKHAHAPYRRVKEPTEKSHVPTTFIIKLDYQRSDSEIPDATTSRETTDQTYCELSNHARLDIQRTTDK